jgi:hypothetical protein
MVLFPWVPVLKKERGGKKYRNDEPKQAVDIAPHINEGKGVNLVPGAPLQRQA